jgi:hypothetical protein
VWETVTVTANTLESAQIVGVQFLLGGAPLGAEDTTAPYSIEWDTTTVVDGPATLEVRGRDQAGTIVTSSATNVTVQNQASTASYLVPPGGTQLFDISGGSNNHLAVGSVTLQTDGTAATPAGVAVIGLRRNGILVAEAGIPASPPVLAGRLFAQVDGITNTGLALMNPSANPVTITYYFTDSEGVHSPPGSFTLAGGREFAAFLDEAPFDGSGPMEASFTFASSTPVGAVGIRAFQNERNEFLFTVLPIVPIGPSEEGPGTEQAVVPLYAIGGGWTTDVILTNPVDFPLTGAVQFVGPTGAPAPTLVNGTIDSSFSYHIPARSTVRLTAASAGSVIQTGSVWINGAGGDRVPTATAIFSHKHGQFTVSQVSISAEPRSSRYSIYAEKSGVVGEVGSIRSGIAVANTTESPVDILLERIRFDGQSEGFVSLSLPGRGQISKFVDELFPGFPALFRGQLRVISSTTPAEPSPIVATGIRGRYNERGDFLLTATPAAEGASMSSSATTVFTHVLHGEGYTTRLILFGDSAELLSGTMLYRSRDGALMLPTNLNAQN